MRMHQTAPTEPKDLEKMIATMNYNNDADSDLSPLGFPLEGIRMAGSTVSSQERMDCSQTNRTLRPIARLFRPMSLVSIAKLADTVTELRFGRTFTLTEVLDYPVEIVTAVKTREDAIIRVTIA
ncbi:MAG: hypothetical protein M1839_000824 [Geoglossum umbratile]|nr:MAG: hypothetical protein M1839_000824 [Geoglossum umbratile]